MCNGCRPVEGVEPDPHDKWETMEFYVKWKRWSYRACSWDTRATLSQLGGYKRVVNYIRRQEDMEVYFHFESAVPAILDLMP